MPRARAASTIVLTHATPELLHRPPLRGTLSACAEPTYKAAKVVFQNAEMYPQAQLEDIAQMHPGTTFTATDLGNAVQHLIDTGFFSDVGATLAPGRADAATVMFSAKPIPVSDMAHVGFENFVWLSHDEILAALHKKAPLFAGYIPDSSPVCADFDTVLIEALAAKGIIAKVTHESFEPTMHHPELVLEYKIETPRIRVTNIKLFGVTPTLARLVQKSVNNAAQFSYNEGLYGQSTADAVLAPLFDAGFAKAFLSDVSLAPTVTNDGVVLVLSAALSAGQIYRVSAINFTGATLYSAEEFAKTSKLHPGDLASREMLLETLEPLDTAYRRVGYADLIIETDPTYDEVAHTVTYNISVVPGEQYRMKEVTADNLDPAALADFNKTFKLTKGELYNPEYVKQFLKDNAETKSLEPYVAMYKAYADPNTHTVDLVLTFANRGLK